MIGVSLGMLCDGSFEDSVGIFRKLQSMYDLGACEIQGESSLYNSSCDIGNIGHMKLISTLRGEIGNLGIHLPFMGLDPVSDDPNTRKACIRLLCDWIDFAAETGADYTVLHLRKDTNVSNDKPGEAIMQDWNGFLESLAEKAYKSEIDLCLENADDMRNFDDVSHLMVNCRNPVKLCLDIGHLYERIYSGSRIIRKMLRLNDLFSPYPFSIDRNLPETKSGGWAHIIGKMSDSIGAIHIHNHDGRMAHKPLSQGKIDFTPLINLAETLDEIPVVIEVDYRHLNRDTIEKDIRLLGELMNNGK